jgi:hypothetical protein
MSEYISVQYLHKYQRANPTFFTESWFSIIRVLLKYLQAFECDFPSLLKDTSGLYIAMIYALLSQQLLPKKAKSPLFREYLGLLFATNSS